MALFKCKTFAVAFAFLVVLPEGNLLLLFPCKAANILA
jgi:hypothetical protein